MTQDCRRRRARAIGISPVRTLVRPCMHRCRHRGFPWPGGWSPWP